MRLGNVAWAWMRDPMDMPTDELLFDIANQIADIGFECIDLIGTPQSMKEYYTPRTIEKLRKHIESLGLEIGTFVSSTPDINHPDPDVRKQVLEDFARGVDIAVALGCPHINITAPRPAGCIQTPVAHGSADKVSYIMAEGYDFKKDWRTYVDSLKYCADLAGSRGLKLSLECFAGTICSTPHAWLRLFEEVGAPNLGIQLDTSHLVTQRFDVVFAIYMTGDRIFNVHAKDNDGMARPNLPPGCGIIDYALVIDALRHVGYDGIISVEVEFTHNPRRYNQQAKEHLEKILKGLY